MEMLEYYNDDNTLSMGVAERSYIHQNNLWHREIAVWLINEKNELLFQRRSPKKKSAPNKLSITAGHVGVKEKETLAALREIKEEIGLNFNENDLKLLGVFTNKQENNYCFSYTYLLKTSVKERMY